MYLFDHLVHFVEKPEQLVEKTREIGLHTVNGGKHEMWGTYNSLCYFGLSYIEFIGIFNEALFEEAASKPFTLHETYKLKQFQNGVVRLAMRSTSIEEDAEKLSSLGYEVYGPDNFSRTRPDGSVLKWKLLHFGKQGQSLEFPFIIQWEGNDNERLKDLTESGTIKPHPLGNLQIKAIEFEVEDLTIATEWGRAFDFEVEGTDIAKMVKTPNCILTFKKSAGENKISQISIHGGMEKLEVVLEGAKYLFNK
ncbi:VOC family protein [Lysinibacillus sp. SGAir0095]|uniref:VOC family protein n=1 Tax=Lysinibacillus sp. SGAir0095 TaxID=2070463 RepID=UPI00143D2108|nr:VOC family protein [Lysinibacillus sp. SGAir0095]